MNVLWEPKVSIVIPVYNGANYMLEAIDSALAQTYPNVEVIVVNDGSCDDGETDRIAQSYGNRIVYIKKENGGVSSALNYGIRQMTGEYFSWLSHDDVYAPDKILNQIEALSVFNDKNAISLCAHCFIDGHSKRLSKKAPKRFQNGFYFWNQVLLEILTNGAFSGCALLLPKKIFDDCGGFDENLRFSQDYLMWMTIFLNGYSLVYNDSESVYSRIHGKQLTQRGREVFKKDSMDIAQLLIPKLASISNKKENFLYLYAKRNAKYGIQGVVDDCIKAAREKKLFKLRHLSALRFELLYGGVRPCLRKLYYKFIVRVK